MYHQTTTGEGIFQMIKGVALALAVSFLSAIVLATVLRFSSLSDSTIYPIAQTIKVVSVFLGAFAFVRGENGFAKGMAIGALFTALSYLTFSALGGDFSLSWWIVIELFLSLLSGAVGGAVAVNIRR